MFFGWGPDGHPAGVEAQHELVDTVHAAMTFLTIGGSKIPCLSRETARSRCPAAVARRFGLEPLWLLPEPAPAGSLCSQPRWSVTSTVNGLQRPFQDRLGHVLETDRPHRSSTPCSAACAISRSARTSSTSRDAPSVPPRPSHACSVQAQSTALRYFFHNFCHALSSPRAASASLGRGHAFYTDDPTRPSLTDMPGPFDTRRPEAGSRTWDRCRRRRSVRWSGRRP